MGSSSSKCEKFVFQSNVSTDKVASHFDLISIPCIKQQTQLFLKAWDKKSDPGVVYWESVSDKRRIGDFTYKNHHHILFAIQNNPNGTHHIMLTVMEQMDTEFDIVAAANNVWKTINAGRFSAEFLECVKAKLNILN